MSFLAEARFAFCDRLFYIETRMLNIMFMSSILTVPDLIQYIIQESRKGLKKQALQVLYESMQIQPDPVCSILLTSRLPVQLAADIQVGNIQVADIGGTPLPIFR